MSSDKSDETSEKLRNDGNQFYAQKRFFDALIKYNESLCFAEIESQNLGLAFANRSAVYFEMKLYDRALRNIELARRHKYPKKNFDILDQREAKCKELKGRSCAQPQSFFKLSYPPRKDIPFVIDSLEVQVNEKYGRHVITNRALKVGDVISFESPFCGVLLSESKFHTIPPSNIYQRCSGCFQDEALDLLPCQSCCKAMFCSQACLDRAFKRFHRYECPIMSELLESGSVHMALRVFFIALSVAGGKVEEVKKLVEESERRNPTIFECGEGEKERLMCLLALVRSSKSFSLDPYEKILEKHQELANVWKEQREFILSFLLRVCQISDLNFHGIFSGNLQKTDINRFNVCNELQQSIGTGALLFSSLINHSCSSNVMRVCENGKVALVVCRPIEKGCQLYDCYKINFMMQTKSERRQQLLREFGFKCDCEACLFDFATPPALASKDMKLLKHAKKTDDEILKLSPGQAMRKFRENCDILEKNHHDYPSIELCLLQKSIATFLLKQATDMKPSQKSSQSLLPNNSNKVEWKAKSLSENKSIELSIEENWFLAAIKEIEEIALGGRREIDKPKDCKILLRS